MSVKRTRKVKRVVLGVGHPWFFPKQGILFDSVVLYSQDGCGERIALKHDAIGGWNKIRLVAEIIK